MHQMLGCVNIMMNFVTLQRVNVWGQFATAAVQINHDSLRDYIFFSEYNAVVCFFMWLV